MSPGPRRLRCRVLLNALKKYGVVEARTSGSHIILLKPIAPGSSKGPTYPVSCHNPGDELSPSIVKAILRAFGIPEDQFWSEV